jgi:hypothetical protein
LTASGELASSWLEWPLFRRLRSTGGRPALDGTDVRRKIPMRQAQWKKLQELARRVESDSFHPTPAQLASVILDAGIDQFERTLDAQGPDRKPDMT